MTCLFGQRDSRTGAGYGYLVVRQEVAMALTGEQYGRVVNDSAHSLAPGAFPGAVAAMWMLSGRGAEAADAIKLGGGVAWMVLAAAVGIAVITGVARLGYWSATIRDDRMEIRSEMALTKHVAFVLLQVLAGVWLITLM